MIQLILLGLLTIYLFSLVLKKKKNYPKGPWRLPIIGNLHQLGEFPQKTFIEMGKKYGPIISIKLGSIETIVLNDYKMMREAQAHPSIAGRMPLTPFIERSNGIVRGIAFTEGKHFNEQRKFMVQTFNELGMGKSLTEDLIQEEIEVLMKNIESKNGKAIELLSLFNAAAINSVMALLFGQKMNHDDPEFLKNIEYVEGITPEKKSIKAAAMVLLWLNKFRKLSGLEDTLKGFKCIENFIRKAVNEHIENVQKGNIGHDFIYSYLNEIKNTIDKSSSFYGRDGIENLVFLLFDTFSGGSETSRHSLEFSIVTFLVYRDIQQKVREEINNVVGIRVPSLSDRSNMPYTEAFINEVMRFNTVLPLGLPRRVTKDVQFHGFTIPAETSVISNFHAAHQDKSAWGDPENFRPERFIAKDGKISKEDAFFAFGSGRRVCPGELFARNSIFIFITRLIQNFKILPDPDNPEKPHLRIENTFITTRPEYSKVVFQKLN